MKKAAPVIFILCLLGAAYYYNYWDILHYRPQSLHHWRQTDCASIALNYYQHGMNFFHPEVLFQISDGGTSGCTVGECPLLYYFIAILWKIFGYSDFIYRLVNVSIFFIGLFSLFKLLNRFIKDSFWAIAIPFIIFTSPVVVFYANNFLTDTTAFAFVIIGWNFFFKYYLEKKEKAFYWAFLFFTIAGLIKVSSLMSVIALAGIFLFKTINFRSDKIPAEFKLNAKKTMTFLLLFGIIFSWYVYAGYYNKKHHAFTSDGTPYFSAQTYPIWNLDKADIKDILKEIKNYWLGQYYHLSMIALFFISALIAIIYFRKENIFLRTMIGFITMGVIIFCVLWFYAFAQHDYYIINLLILPIFIFICILEYLSVYKPKILSSIPLKTAFTLFILFNINYTKGKTEERYFGWQNEYPAYKDIHSITPYLREIGIKPTDKVISLPDGATCYTLYLMNQPGWSGTNFFYDSAQVEKYISLGAKYLILSDEELLTKPGLQPFLKNKIGHYGTATVFKLK